MLPLSIMLARLMKSEDIDPASKILDSFGYEANNLSQDCVEWVDARPSNDSAYRVCDGKVKLLRPRI